MKNLLVSFIFCFASVSLATAQNKLEMYCKVNVAGKKNGTEKIVIDYGKDQIFSDTSMATKLGKVNTFHNSIDALNYMSSLGWEYITTTSPVRYVSYAPLYTYVYLFKKTSE